MTPGDEHKLYECNRAAWLAEVAPRMAKRIDDIDNDLLGHVWGSMPRDYQEATWVHMTEPQRHRIRSVRAGKAA